MADVIAVIILVVLIGGAAVYLIRAKRNGVKCVGCPAGGNCSNQRKRKRKKAVRPHYCEKNYGYFRNALWTLCSKCDRQSESD